MGAGSDKFIPTCVCWSSVFHWGRYFLCQDARRNLDVSRVTSVLNLDVCFFQSKASFVGS